MTIEIGETQRGFSKLEFTDRNGVRCSLQQSSLASEDCIWLGCNDLGLKRFEAGKGWQDVELENVHPGGPYHSANTRMHLTREQVAELLPHLQRFAYTGELAVSTSNNKVT